MAPPDPAWTPAPGEVIGVGELVARASALLARSFAWVWVEGEVSNLRIPASGHAYFTLGDRDAQLRAVCFRSTLRLVNLRPRDGLRVVVRGRLAVYESRGDLQLLVEDFEPVGDGLHRLRLDELRRRLSAEGLFDEGRKRALPRLPRGVGVVTSPTGAALQDLLKVLGARAPGVSVYVAPARVQGRGAAAELCEALATAAAHPAVDLVILGRGGGTAEDLGAFDEEALVRAIAGCRVPVISAVGHETDVTLADLAADVRAATPSAAAEIAVRDWSHGLSDLRRTEAALHGAVARRLLSLRRRLTAADPSSRSPAVRVQRSQNRLDRLLAILEDCERTRLRTARAALAGAEKTLLRLGPEARLAGAVGRLERLEDRLSAGCGLTLERGRGILSNLASRLDALSPLRVLSRGYAVARRGPEVLRLASRCEPGDEVTVTLEQGRLDCRVERVHREREVEEWTPS